MLPWSIGRLEQQAKAAWGDYALRGLKLPQAILQLRIELAEVRSKVWRRILVPQTITLLKLHTVIQARVRMESHPSARVPRPGDPQVKPPHGIDGETDLQLILVPPSFVGQRLGSTRSEAAIISAGMNITSPSI